MVNEVVLVGVVNEIRVEDEYRGGLFLKIEKQFSEGYDRVFEVVECRYWKSIHQKTIASIKEGDTVAIKGRIESENYKFAVMIENVVLLNKTKNIVSKSL